MNFYIDKIINVLRGGLTNKVKYFYFGDPYILPKAILEQGVILVAPSKNDVATMDTQRDRDEMEIVITVMKDMRQDFDKTPQKTVVAKWLTEIIEGRDINGVLQSSTIRHIIRENLTVIGTVSDISIEYGVTERDEALVGAGKITFNLTDFTNR